MKYNGFTLIELLFCILVSSILALCTSASWTYFKQKNEKDVLIAEIKNAIHYVKIIALNEAYPMNLSSINEDWSKGMRLKSSQSRQLIHQWDWNHPHWTVRWYGLNGEHHIVLAGNTHAMSNGRFVLENRFTHEKIVLILNKLGRIRMDIGK